MAESQTSPEALAGSSFLEALSRAPFSIVITDPKQPDNPIIYVNETFTSITGFAKDFAVGKNCRFLQGKDTSQSGLEKLRSAIDVGKEVSVDINNYRPDGELFRNRLMISPLFSEEGELSFYLGIQMELEASLGETKTDDDMLMQRALFEIQHRVKNHLSMVVGMIRIQARSAGDDGPHDFDTLARRVETLQLLYEELSERNADGERDETVALGAYLSRVANAIAHLDGRSGIRVNIESEKISVPFQAATQLGLIVSELMTNALQHAFVDREEGLLEVEAKSLSNGVFRVVVSDDGRGIPDGVDWPKEGNLGSRIVRQLVAGLNATLEVGRGDVQGTTLTLDVPQASLTDGSQEREH